MKLARYVFIIAGIWGIAVLMPFYWLVDVTGRRYRAPTEYPHFFYGFFAVALAWQITFLVIGYRPDRYRSLMLLGMLAFAIAQPFQESKTYNKLTGAHTTWWDALFCELRVQGSVKQ